MTNIGKYDGAEVVQLYTQDLVRSITPPEKELKGFQKIFLKAGETKTIDFKVSPKQLAIVDENYNFFNLRDKNKTNLLFLLRTFVYATFSFFKSQLFFHFFV